MSGKRKIHLKIFWYCFKETFQQQVQSAECNGEGLAYVYSIENNLEHLKKSLWLLVPLHVQFCFQLVELCSNLVPTLYPHRCCNLQGLLQLSLWAQWEEVQQVSKHCIKTLKAMSRKLVRFLVLFDNSSLLYFPGQFLSGRVLVELKDDTPALGEYFCPAHLLNFNEAWAKVIKCCWM